MALNENALALARNPNHRGALGGATHYGVGGHPGDGPYFELWIEAVEGKVRNARYESPGCPSSRAIGGALCVLITGREMSRIFSLEKSDLVAFIGSLPEGKEHYLDLAVTALSGLAEIDPE